MIATITSALPQIFEAGMMIGFGFSWPISIFKSWRTKYVRGKSIAFMCLVFVGYLCGIAAKCFEAAEQGQFEHVTILYVLNAIFVAIDISLYFKYRRNHEPLSLELARDIATEIAEEEKATHR